MTTITQMAMEITADRDISTGDLVGRQCLLYDVCRSIICSIVRVRFYSDNQS